MVIKWNITIPELTGSTERRAYVYIPDEAESCPEKRYPVLYMFDGHNVFFDQDATYGKSWGMKEYAEKNNLQLIIAAVECDHSPNYGRLSEYSPVSFSFPKVGKIKGRGKETMDWFVGTFKPYIDKKYPTLPDREHTFIAGSSMGGLMSLYAVSQYNHIFSRAAALSPSIWVSPKKIYAILKNASYAGKTVVYMDYGSKEFANHLVMKPCFAKTGALLIEKGVMLESRIVPGGKHNEASWEKQIPFFMNTLLYGLEK